MIIYQEKDVRGRYLDKANVVGCRHQYTCTTSLLNLIRTMLKVEIYHKQFWCDSEIHSETPQSHLFLTLNRIQQSFGSTWDFSIPPSGGHIFEVGWIMALRKESDRVEILPKKLGSFGMLPQKHLEDSTHHQEHLRFSNLRMPCSFSSLFCRVFGGDY